ncbi:MULTISPECIES: BON domain-containing protein [unclassified Luteimonas]|uniref:BON domain-containing protein n=1 Tax=unclassified Luteimonas TaxID=2629088 RepID=UPI0016180FDC|nr:BON domain-containing protein [Luteimonas sp. RC10]MBB3342193.1 hyperosmotically inducible protein [Luteimonas sp. RC10]
MKTLHKTLMAGALAGAVAFTGSALAQDHDRKDHTTAAQTDSHQPMSDTWITTKVKADLLASSDVSGLDISVETSNGIVSLSGDVETQAQIDRATAIARGIEGVKSVDAKQLKVATGTSRR